MESGSSKQAENLNIYFAGELFSLKHLAGNASLAYAILRESNGRYVSVVPQCLEQRESSDLEIRDQDISELMSCDVGLFHFDGDEIDSGTVAEYMIAKFLDIPAVIVRTDFRSSSDGSSPWNLMLSFYPRTKVLVEDGMSLFQTKLKELAGNPTDAKALLEASANATQLVTVDLARNIIKAFDDVIAEPSIMPSSTVKSIFEWIRHMPGKRFSEEWNEEKIARILERKRGLTHL